MEVGKPRGPVVSEVGVRNHGGGLWTQAQEPKGEWVAGDEGHMTSRGRKSSTNGV